MNEIVKGNSRARDRVMAESSSNQPLLTTKDAARHLRVSPRTLIRWRELRKGPPYVRAVRKILYHPSDIDAWLERNRQDPVAEV